MTVYGVLGDAAAVSVGCALLVAAVPKIVAPEELGAVLSGLWSRLGRPAGSGWFNTAGRAVGVLEVCVAVWAVVGRGAAAGVAVVAVAAGFAGAGAVGAVSGGGLRCGCFAGHSRMLGWSQVAALPVWAVLAWGVAQPAELFSGGARGRLALLVGCCAVAAAAAGLRLWGAVRSQEPVAAG